MGIPMKRSGRGMRIGSDLRRCGCGDCGGGWSEERRGSVVPGKSLISSESRRVMLRPGA